MRLIYTYFILCFWVVQVAGQSGRPFLEIGKRGRDHNAPIAPIKFDTGLGVRLQPN